VQRHQPHPVELGVPDRDQPVDQVDVVAGQRERLPESHAASNE
jgi:hypothetical protein